MFRTLVVMRQALLLAAAPLALTLFLSSCSLSSEISPGTTTSKTLMAEWNSDFEKSMTGLNRTAPLPGGRLLVLGMEDEQSYMLESWSPLLSREWTTNVILEDDEEQPMLMTGKGRTVLLTLMELENDAVSIRSRDVNSAKGEVSSPKAIVTTTPDFDGDFEFRHPRDTSWSMVYAFGDDFDVKTPDGANDPYREVYTGIIDMASGTVRTTHDTVRYGKDQDDDDDILRDAAVSSDGTAAIVEILQAGDRRYEMLVHRVVDGRVTRHRFHVPNRLDSLIPGYDDDDYAWPTDIRVSFQEDGSLYVASDLARSGALKVMTATVINPSFSNASYSTPIIFDEETVEMMSGDEEDELSETYRITDAITHPNGSITLIHESSRQVERGKYSQDLSKQYTEWIYDPLLITHLDRMGKVISSSWIDRQEKWRPLEYAYFEAGYSWMVDGDWLFLALREREKEGVMLYSLSLTGQEGESRLITKLGNMAYFGSGFTTWHGPRDITMFLKAGPTGRDWQIMRVTP